MKNINLKRMVAACGVFVFGVYAMSFMAPTVARADTLAVGSGMTITKTIYPGSCGTTPPSYTRSLVRGEPFCGYHYITNNWNEEIDVTLTMPNAFPSTGGTATRRLNVPASGSIYVNLEGVTASDASDGSYSSVTNVTAYHNFGCFFLARWCGDRLDFSGSVGAPLVIDNSRPTATATTTCTASGPTINITWPAVTGAVWYKVSRNDLPPDMSVQNSSRNFTDNFTSLESNTYYYYTIVPYSDYDAGAALTSKTMFPGVLTGGCTEGFPAYIYVDSSACSASAWTISPEGQSGSNSNNGDPKTVYPAVGGTSYTLNVISPAVATVTNSKGPSSTMSLVARSAPADVGTFYISCTSSDKTVTVTAAPPSIAIRGTSTVSWSTGTGITSCATDSWSNSTAKSGSAEAGPGTTTTYTKTCYDSAGASYTDSAVVTVENTRTFVWISPASQTITNGQSATLTWGGSNISSCYGNTPTANWTGTSSPSGSVTVSPTSTTTYTMNCIRAPGGDADPGASAVIYVTAVMSGTLTSSASSCTIASGGSSCNVNLSWTTTNPVATSAVTASGMTSVNGNSGTNVSFVVPYSSRTFYLYNNGQSLVPTPPNGGGISVTASCVAGTAWNTTTNTCASTSYPSLSVGSIDLSNYTIASAPADSHVAWYDNFLQRSVTSILHKIMPIVHAAGAVTGQPIRLSTPVTNSGISTNTAFTNKFYIDINNDNPSNPPGPTGWDLTYSPTLPGIGSNATVNSSADVPEGLPQGTHGIVFCADWDTSVSDPAVDRTTRCTARTVSYVGPVPPTGWIRCNGQDTVCSISSGSSATITWSSSNTSSCSVEPTGWSGTENSTGRSTGALTTNKIYTLECMGTNGSPYSDDVQVAISTPTCPDGSTPPCGGPPSCPPPSTGRYPNCICPVGWTGTAPNCIGPTTCAELGLVGTWPNCPGSSCDLPLTGTPPNCIGPTTCTERGLNGTYPNCVVPKKPIYIER